MVLITVEAVILRALGPVPVRPVITAREDHLRVQDLHPGHLHHVTITPRVVSRWLLKCIWRLYFVS